MPNAKPRYCQVYCQVYFQAYFQQNILAGLRPGLQLACSHPVVRLTIRSFSCKVNCQAYCPAYRLACLSGLLPGLLSANCETRLYNCCCLKNIYCTVLAVICCAALYRVHTPSSPMEPCCGSHSISVAYVQYVHR
jgi:hypothetical protein